MSDDPVAQVVRLAAVGAAAWAGYEFVYRPWALRRDLEDLTRRTAAGNVAKGMSLTDAASAAVAAGCVAGSAVYGAPPVLSGPICKGLAPLAVAGAKEAVKGAAVAAKLLGKETSKGARVVAKGAKAVGSTAKKILSWGLGDVDLEDRTIQSARARAGRTKQSAAAAAADFYLRHL